MRKMQSMLSSIFNKAIRLKKISLAIPMMVLSGACVHDATKFTQSDVIAVQEESRVADPHLITKVSANNFETTLAQAIAGINNRGFKTFAVIDHAAGAASIDQTLRPTTLVIFGNPKGGTPLMQSAQTMGIELPLKILVHQNEDASVGISYPDMAHIFEVHGVKDRAPILQKIQGALGAITAEASEVR